MIQRRRSRAPFGKGAAELVQPSIASHGQHLAKLEVCHEAKECHFEIAQVPGPWQAMADFTLAMMIATSVVMA